MWTFAFQDARLIQTRLRRHFEASLVDSHGRLLGRMGSCVLGVIAAMVIPIKRRVMIVAHLGSLGCVLTFISGFSGARQRARHVAPFIGGSAAHRNQPDA